MWKRIFSKPNRALLSELVRTDFKLRYQGSVLGYAWSLLRPLLIFIILYFVFVKFLKIGNGVPHYPVYLLLGIVLWNFFTELTQQGMTSIVNRGDLIRKIKIPRWIIVLSTSVSALINLGLNIIVIVIFMIINRVPVMLTDLLVPVFLFEIFIFAFGISLLTSAIFVQFRDLSYIWEVLLQAGFYITPILYPLSRISSPTLQKIILLNPMAQSIQATRYVSITHTTLTTQNIFHGGGYMFLPYALALLLPVVGIFFFRKRSKFFAENI